MNYVDPVKYSKAILALMEDESMPKEETVQVKDPNSMKERVGKLSPDDKKKLEEYIDAIKEIKKEIKELINKDAIAESGGNQSSGLTMNVREEDIDLNEYDQLLGAIENLLNQGESSQNILRVVKDTLGYE
jgi:CRISPR/Cas system CSM-associated protein Csm4 (group 5 of RAMP superfamily)